MSNLLHNAHQRLLADDAVQRRLAELKGWTLDAIRRLGLGLDAGRVVIPVLGPGGPREIKGVLRYQPSSAKADGLPKMMAAPGVPRELFPPPEFVDDSTIWLVEGEPDAISATSIGLPAVGIPGAGGWRSEWAERFSGRNVVVCCDCDGPGRGLAARVADDLVDHATTVRVVDLAAARDDGYDIGEFIVETDDHDGARALLERVAEHAPIYVRREDRPPRPRLEVVEVRRLLRDYLDGRYDNAPAWPLPWRKLNEITDGGIRAGELWVVAGWTSHAKSVVADHMLDSAAQAGARSHLYMTEMTVVQRGLRAVARRTGMLDLRSLRRRTLDETQRALAEDAINRLPYGISLVRDWSPRQVALDAVASRTQFAVVDHLHDFFYRDEREITDHLDQLRNAINSDAAGLYGGSALLVVCQLNERQMGDSRSGHLPRPGLHAIKAASAIKQKADVVLFVWLDNDENGVPYERRPGVVDAEIWAAKGRNGGAGGVSRVELNTGTLELKERLM